MPLFCLSFSRPSALCFYGVVIMYLSWENGNFLRGVFSRNAILRRVFKQIAKNMEGV